MKSYLFVVVLITLCCQAAFAQSDSNTETIKLEKTSSDGSVMVHIESNLPKKGAPLFANIIFSNTATGSILHDVNYDVVAMQNGEIVLSQMGMYAKDGKADHTTAPLSTDNHVEVMIVLQGIGSEAPYSGPKGDMLKVTVIPEFGITSFVLFSAVFAALSIQRMRL